jgi:dTDP-L-rhamnose 4-epimerase
MERILISGGAGFIGSHTTLALADRGYSVTVLDNLSPQIHGNVPESSHSVALIRNKAHLIRGDIRNSHDWSVALRDQDAVIHLAAETGTGQSMYEVGHYTDVNVQGTARLLDMLVNHKHRISKVVVASSRAVYGEGKYTCELHGLFFPQARGLDDMAKGDFAVKCPICGSRASPIATDEEAQLQPFSVYGITKLTQECLVLSVCRSIGIPAIALRYQNVYGPGQSLINPYTGILAIFSMALLNGEEINIFEDGQESRDFIYIEDVVNANIAALGYEKHDAVAINVGSGIPVSVQEVAETLGRAYGVIARYCISGKYRAGDIRHNFADTRRCRALLGIAPQWSFREGISRFARWVGQEVRQGGGSAMTYRASLEEMRLRGLFR